MVRGYRLAAYITFLGSLGSISGWYLGQGIGSYIGSGNDNE